MTKQLLTIGSCNNCPYVDANGVSIYTITSATCCKTGEKLVVNNFGYIIIPETCKLPKVKSK